MSDPITLQRKVSLLKNQKSKNVTSKGKAGDPLPAAMLGDIDPEDG